MTLHTDIPTRSELERLLAVRDPLCVSLYIPTSPLTQEAQSARIELKTLTADAMRQLEDAGAVRRALTDLREPLEELVDDEDFWSEQARSLAVFAAPARVRTFRLPNRLTSELEVGDRFYVKPLLRAVAFPQAAFVLALAAGGVRVVEVAAEGPSYAVDVPGLPKDLAGGLGAAAAERTHSDRLIGAEGDKVRLRQFARKVDQALRGLLAGRQLPLILAATEPLDSIYRSLNSYPALAASGIPGNPEALSDDELAAAARSVLDELYAAELAAVRAEFGARFQDGRASSDVATVARAATLGAVDTVLVDIDDKVPGEVDEAGAVTLSDDDAVSYGVVDEIARRVLLTGGRVLAVRQGDLPDPTPVAAILRHRL